MRYKKVRHKAGLGFLLVRSVLPIGLVAILSLNMVATGVPGLVQTYADQQARIPHPLASKDEPDFAPAADAKPATGKAAKISDELGQRLAAERDAKVKGKKRDATHVQKLAENRTEHDTVYLNKDGTKSLERSAQATSYKDTKGEWRDVDASLAEEKVEDAPGRTTGTWRTKANDWHVRFGEVSDTGAIEIIKGTQTVTMKPVGGKTVKPVVTGQAPDQIVTYRNVWQGIDLQYKVSGSELTETIVIKSRAAQSSFDFDVAGTGISPNPDQPGGFRLEGELSDFTIAAPTVATFKKGVIGGAPLVSQSYADGRVHINLDKAWLASRTFEEFPIAVDPTIVVKPTDNGNTWYRNFRSDGFICDAGQGCGNSTGNASNDLWRFIYHVDFSPAAGHFVSNAQLHLEMPTPDGVHYYGTYDPRWIISTRATCITSINCADTAYGEGWATIGSSGEVDVTDLYRNAVENNDITGIWMMVRGDETANFESYKQFAYDRTSVTITYDNPPSVSSLTAGSPADGGIAVTTQPGLKTTTAVDPEGEAVSYRYTIGTGKTGAGGGRYSSLAGTIAESGSITAPSWTVPDNVLQDGTTYYWQVSTQDSVPNSYSNFSPVYSFKVDLREGKDTTQAFDNVGPASVNLATGNLTTGAKSHSISALGGAMGVGLDYNSPQRSRAGLVGEYWNDTAHTGAIPGSAPVVTKVDPNIEFAWGGSSPAVGLVDSDYFVARWTGYITAPATGSYQFGLTGDDGARIYINNQLVKDAYGCCSAANYGSAVALTGGVPVPIRVEYNEVNNAAYMSLLVKGAIAEQAVPADWLQTGVRPTAMPHGLIGHYYTDDGSHNFPSNQDDPARKFLTRTDTSLNLNWGTGSPVPNGPADNFLVRWTGYFTAPQADTYTFGALSDDGIRIIANGNTVVQNWTDHAPTKDYAPSGIALSQGQSIPITIEYYEHTNGAQVSLLMKRLSQNNIADFPLDPNWLSPRTQVLPDGWNLSLDADGNLGYDYAVIGQNSVTLRGSSGESHEYKYTGGGYSPPAGEDGQLVRNGDGTLTLQDTDGRTYVFNADGTLKLSTNPLDDLHPAALKYDYNGTPTHLDQITDGVNPGRWMKAFYAGDTACPSVPSGYANPPSGMICAVASSDGQTTQFVYTIYGTLGRIVKPGNDITDFGYDSLGRVNQIRSSLANDVIAAGGRSQDTSVLTEIAYDPLGRVSGVTLPAANAGDVRQSRSYDYRTAAVALNRFFAPTIPDHRASVASVPGTYGFEAPLGLLQTTSAAGTHALYSCLAGGYDEFTSTASNCEGQAVIGLLGYAYDNAPANTPIQTLYRCTVPGDHFDSTASNCEGQGVELFLGYIGSNDNGVGYTQMHVGGATEPNGYTRRTTYDTAYRTTAENDAAGLTTAMRWDVDTATGSPRKDLLLSTTDPAGLRTTTIYDYADRPTDNYGPAPSSYFNADGTPGSGVVGQTPHTQTGYDESIKSLAATYYNVSTASNGTGTTTKLLEGTPKLHGTGIGHASGDIDQTWNAVLPFTPDSGKGWGVRLTGDIHLTTAGAHTFRVYGDDGVRVWIDDQLVINDWADGAKRSHPTGTFTNAASPADSWHRIRIDYYNKPADTDAMLQLFMTPPGGSETSALGNLLKPRYNLATSQKTFDTQIGDVTSTTNYGATPEFGLAQSSSIDPTPGLNLTGSATYEAPGASGSYLRQTSKTLPGGGTTGYTYYSGTETRDNPCTTGTTESYKQAGMLKTKTEASPSVAVPGRATETIYDDAGRTVATRYNADPWTCTSYDARGRVTQVAIPSINGQPARTVANTWVMYGDPLVVQTSDSSGYIQTKSDLLGRLSRYVDALGETTDYTYDNLGRLTTKVSPMGTEAFVYDNYNRLTQQKFDSTIYATVTYDAYGRMSGAAYPTAGSSALAITRDALGRTTGKDYTLGNGTTHLADSVTRSQSGQVVSGTELGAAKSYTYDKAGRLTAATIGANTYAYGFGPENGVCDPSTNPNAGKNGNRTSQTINGATSYYCYDYADRLVQGTNANIDVPAYDSHGNTINMGTSWNGKYTEFTYDSSDRNIGILQNWGDDYDVSFERDVTNRIMSRFEAGLRDASNWYGFTGPDSAPDFTRDESWAITEKYLQLPGGTLLTLRPNATPTANKKIFSLTNIHGDVFATLNASGTQIATFQYDPFGNSTTTPNNTQPGTSFGWAGQHQKASETDLALKPIQMGARVYIPSIGRFLQVDPVDGGVQNNYIYPPDPVNASDYNGKKTVGQIVTTIGQYESEMGVVLEISLLGLGIAACVATTGIACTVVIPLISAFVAGTKDYSQNQDAIRAVSVGGLTGAFDRIGSAGGDKLTGVAVPYVARLYKQTTQVSQRALNRAVGPAKQRTQAVTGAVVGYSLNNAKDQWLGSLGASSTTAPPIIQQWDNIIGGHYGMF